MSESEDVRIALRNILGELQMLNVADKLTKRELFAAMAMQGMACPGDTVNEIHNAVNVAVCYADALLAELSKDPQR